MAAEGGLKAEVEMAIKPDPDLEGLSSDDDDDDYEDTGELHFPKVALQEAPWLVRVPADLWTGINRLKMDEPIQLGELWLWEDPGKKTTMRWKIDPRAPGFDMIPKEYDLQKVEHSSNYHSLPKNMFVFSEKDLAGFRPNAWRYRGNQGQDSLKKTEGGRIDKSKQRGPRTIPKHTTYVGTPGSEIHCNPRETDEWRKLQARKEAAERARRPATMVHDVKNAEQLRTDESFLRIGESKKPRPTENKYQRMDEAVLLEILSQKFQKYKFWSLKVLKEEVQQPEQYLRDVLSKIAELIKTGPAANTWTLKSDAQATMNLSEEDLAKMENVNEEDIAPDIVGTDEDDDDADMEDVL